MFGISSKDTQLLENIINEIFDITTGKRNLFRYSKSEFSTNSLKKIKQIIDTRIQDSIKQNQTDMYAVAESQRIILRVKNGWYSELIEPIPASAELNSFKITLNDMIKVNQSRFDDMATLLETYAKNDYTSCIELHQTDEAGGILERLIKGMHAMQNTINTMLCNSLQNGIELQNDAGNLKQAVEALSTASNQQAASLEETAGAMEEMTSNVQQNAQKANDMASMAAQTDASAKEGAQLAQRTATAMTEIQVATDSINNAVAIIENIAFQTNILSLNAAVEAATAGDAGKGFAVVAQEVRNLANRSADAAKEIKAMAAQAAAKSNEGMNIATELTRGFEVIAGKIEQTTMLVQDVSNASREQMQGIGQINTAVTQLDQMTQENAKIAAEADTIANATIEKATAMVEDAASKNFIGKEQIKGKLQHICNTNV
ncbi:MAG: methyl-accepting chemotaxis protein [Sulfuricurvum sp.]|nr:methyl-accepting chemotaxis protein [Sulfuricurvum sp.]